MSATFAPSSSAAIPLHVVSPDGLEGFLGNLPDSHRAWARANGFSGKLGQVLSLPDEAGGIAGVLAGWGDAGARARGRFHLAPLAGKLPAGDYRLASFTGSEDECAAEALGWLLGSYSYDRYRRSEAPARARLVAPEGLNAARIEAIAASACLTRDLINTPASDMGPGALEDAAAALASDHGAEFTAIRGAALLEENFPMIHAVGRASDEEPRLLDMRWGDPSAPRITLVGKGVCFDTGGLNIKPGNSMGLMKKDMGGAATAMGLARMIMVLGLPVRLRLLIPAVENAIGGNAFRPGDILTARNGMTVEVNNTDAEGRLVLADALALGGEESPRHMISLATLTGAARVAVGPDLAPFYAGDDGFATLLSEAGARVADPVWRMPFHDPYEEMIEPGIADLDNAPSGGFAGSITAALFLRRFKGKAESYTHFDIYGWTPAAKPGRPKGGACQAAHAILEALEADLAGA